jgi:hypothetical protein
MRTHQWLTIGILLGLLAATLWYGSTVWSATSQMSTYAHVAMVFGAVVMIALGCGLIALMYYSRRHGYDDAVHRDHTRRDS